MKVSVTAEIVRKRMCLNISAVSMPKNIPIATETAASEKNWAIIKKGVEAENSMFCSCNTVLNNTIETMSLKTPSPKMHEYNFGWASKSTIETAATTSEEQRRAVNRSNCIIESSTGMVFVTCPLIADGYYVAVIFMYLSTAHEPAE